MHDVVCTILSFRSSIYMGMDKSHISGRSPQICTGSEATILTDHHRLIRISGDILELEGWI
jgi:hypothetical protein